LQTLSATNQARLLLGPPSVTRIDPPRRETPIEMDDWSTARDVLPPAAVVAVSKHGAEVAQRFLADPADAYNPVPMA
ncbi:MAG TPA: patatin, partial [Devosia sp.]|nr:patatin [Devosia sp.]